ncbi:co-chaperone YbbN [Bacillus sp. CDB3]|uniref:thioredoxin family protein n=1 Tax=Bacillus sp. CDB3 TaxID=360310 RepID=UPI0021187256|nr:thioredoxin family protein [Bacillus sp. CDB3]
MSVPQLQQQLQNQITQFVYFYQAKCSHCETAASILNPLTREMNIEMKNLNLQTESKSVWEEFHIIGTPTLVYFQKGKEIDRIEGAHKKSDYQQWFQKYTPTK